MISGTPLAEAASILPSLLAERLNGLKEGEACQVEELRLRRGYPMSVLLGGRELPVGGAPVTETDLRGVLEAASRASAHTVLEQVKQGFVTLRGGHRIGLCGTVSRQDGETRSLRYLSSLSIRVARAVEGQTNGLAGQLLEQGCFQNTLIVGPPGSGKTTLLRELIRVLSDGHGVPPFRVGLADERGEIAATWLGQPQFRVGRRTDVLDGCPKSEGMLMLLAYSLGLGIPFVLSAVLIDYLKSGFNRIKAHYRIINLVSGCLLIAIGVLMATGTLGRLLNLLS